jgi:small basic protein
VTTIIAGALCAAATGGICGILAGFVTQLIEATLAAFLAAVGVEAYLGASMVLGVSLWGGLQYAFVGPGKPC